MYRQTVSTFITFYTLTLTSLSNAMPFNGSVTMPGRCKGKYLCFEKHVDYPDTIIEDLLKGIEHLVVELPDYPVEDRFGGDDGDNECESRVYMKPIYEIIDEKDYLRFVVQSEEKFKQIIRTEECMRPGTIREETTNLATTIVNQYNLSCEQCTLKYDFLVLSLDGKKLETARMKGGVPVCCSCRRNQ